MKKYCLFLLIPIIVCCIDKDIPNQFTSVEGIVTDYYSKQPVPEIPLVITEDSHYDYFHADLIFMDTIYTNTNGYYYFEFFNDSDRFYTIEIIQSEYYYSIYPETITEGRIDTINFSVKPFKTLTLNCYNQSKTIDRLHIFCYINNYVFRCNQCGDLTIVNLKIVPELENEFAIEAYKENKMDTIKSKFLKFFAGKNDTTINYYY
jgi:hypothetical protein